ncbi:MAG: DUF2335 domain-containing protein [Deltaproteobacteria bacterium]|nr:DUF2335 domain-containing protein [Deltaproteobacteria bacterium]
MPDDDMRAEPSALDSSTAGLDGEKPAPKATRVSLTQVSAFQGPLPPPEVLRSYEAACPGAAERILAMAEGQIAHRQDVEKQLVASRCRVQDRGPLLGFVMGVLVISIGGICLWQGKDIAGLVALVGALAAVVIPFVYGKRHQKRESKRRRDDALESQNPDASFPPVENPDNRLA